MNKIYHITGKLEIPFEWIVKINESKDLKEELMDSDKFLNDLVDAVYDYRSQYVSVMKAEDKYCVEDNINLDLTKGE